MARELITIEDAANISGVSGRYIRQIAPDIPGAVLRRKEGLRGRWYVPRSWAEAYESERGDKAERVRKALEQHPEASSAEIARVARCSASYVRKLRREIRA